MAAKNRIQLQVDTTFIGDAKNLTKQIENEFKTVDLGKHLTTAAVSLTKTLKTQLDDLQKKLNTPGKTQSQYVRIFEDANKEIQTTISNIQNLKQTFQTMFDSKSNRDNIKQLDALKERYEALTKLAKDKKTAESLMENSIGKLEKKTGASYSGANITQFKDIYTRYKEGGDKNLTPKQKELLGVYDAQGKILKGQRQELYKILDYIEQILKHAAEIREISDQAKEITGSTSNIELGMRSTAKAIDNQEGLIINEDQLNAAKQAADAVLGKTQQLNNTLQATPGYIDQATRKAEAMQSVIGALRDVAAQFGIVFTAGGMVRKFLGLIKTSYNFYKSLDSALNEIYVVSNLSSQAVSDLTGRFINMAESTGMAIDDVTEAAVLFYQQGLNTDEVMTMTEVTAQFAKVAGTDAADAANKLTAAVNGYCLAAEDASSVADKFNQVAAASAADINELSTAFSKAAAQANQAGVGMDNYLAYIATMVEATREAPENIGTSLKTIFSRMQQVKKAGTTEDGETDVNQVEAALKSVGIALRDTNGELRDLEDVFDELGPKWQSLDRNTQAYLGTIIAGTRQQSRFITLMQNWDRVLDLAAESENSAGMQALMHAKAMESLESSTQRAKVAWQEFVSNIANSEVFKTFIDMWTKFLNNFNKGSSPLTLIMTAVTTLSLALSKMTLTVKDLGNGFKRIGTAAKAGIGQIGQAFGHANSWAAAGKSGVDYAGIAQNMAGGIEAEVLKVNELQAANQLISEKLKVEGQSAEELQKLNNEQRQNNILIAESVDKITGYKTVLDEATVAQMKQAQATQTATNMIVGAVSTITMLIGLFGDLNKTSSQATIGVIALAGGITVMIMALEKSLEASPKINLILTAISLLTTGIVSLVQAFNKDTEAIKKNGLTEAIDSLSAGLDKLKSQTAGVSSVERLRDEYEDLAKTLGRTAAQQERMNLVAQELSDALEIDVLTDAHGNLTVSMRDVTEAIEQEREKLNELREEMKQTEEEAMKLALETGNTLTEYLNKVYGSYSSTYKTMITGLKDDLTSSERAISDSTVDAINSYFKSYMLEYAKALKETDVTEWLTEQDAAITEALNKDVGSSKGYEKVYDLVADLQAKGDSLTFNEAEESMDEFFEQYGAQLGLSAQQWEAFKKSITNTVFGNDSLMSFLSELEEKMSKLNGSYWTDPNTGLLSIKEKELRELFNQNIDATDFNAWMNGDDTFSLTWGADEDAQIERMKELIKQGKTAKQIVRDLAQKSANNEAFAPWWSSSKQGDKVLDENVEKVQEYIDLYNEYQNSVKDFQVENGLEDLTYEEVEKIYESMGHLYDIISDVNIETGNFLAQSKELLSLKNVNPEDYEAIVEGLSKIDGQLQNFDTDAERYVYIRDNLLKKILESDDLSEEGKAKVQKMLDEWFSGLSVNPDINWKQFSTEIVKVGETMKKIDGIMEDLADDNHITIDSFLALGEVITELMNNMEGLGELGKLDELGSVLKNLKVEFDENAGALTVNGDAMKDMAKLETALVKAKLITLKTTIMSNLMEAEARKIALQSEIDATKNTIERIKTECDAEVTAAEVRAIANDEYGKALADDADQMGDIYETMTGYSKTWATTTIKYITKVDEAFGKLGTGQLAWEDIEKEITKIQEGLTWSGYNWIGLDEDDPDDAYFDKADLLASLNEYLTTLNNSMDSTLDSIENYRSMLLTIDDLLKADDLSGLFGDTGKEELEKYVGQLEEIYNLLRKIEGIESRLSHLEKYDKLTYGKDKAQFLQERVKLSQQLNNNYTELLAKQKYIEQTEQNAIKNSKVGDVFTFDEYGNIQMDWDKYKNLSNESKKGQMSDMELADKLYEEYQSLHEVTLDYYDKVLDGIEQTIDAQQQLVDTYIETEKEIANATKKIYEDMLENKLEAIDTEIEALDKLREAREQANQAREDSEELSQLQEDLKRAMMDSSGASNTKVLNYQDQIKKKLEDMGEDEYTRRLDSIQEALEDEKEQLQRNFDEYFKDWTKFHEMVKSRIMSDEDASIDVLKTTDEYLQASEEERREMEKSWRSDYQVGMSVIADGGTIKGVQDAITILQDSILTKIDELLKDDDNVIAVGTMVSRIIAEYKAQQEKEAASASNNNNKNTSGGKDDDKDKGKGNGDGDGDDKPYTPPKLNLTGYTGDFDNDIKKGAKVEFKAGNGTTVYGSASPDAANSSYFLTDEKGSDPDATYQGDRQWAPNWYGQGKGAWVGKFKYKQKKYYTFTQRGMERQGVKWVDATAYFPLTKSGLTNGEPDIWQYNDKYVYKKGGMAYHTGPAWLDGTKSAPEAVLNAAQTQAFLKFADHLDMFETGESFGNNIMIESIEFRVDSMSSIADGEKAFDAFVNRFKEIGKQKGVSINTTRLK